MCITWLLHIYTQLTFPKRSNLTIRYLNDDGHILYLLLHDIFIGLFQKRTTPHPQRKFLLSREGEGNRMKNVLNLYRMSIRGGGVLISSMGGYRYFLEQPTLWKHKKKLLSRNKLPCIFNILIVAIKI